MSDSQPKRHPQTGLPINAKPTQQRVVEQATQASEKTKDQDPNEEPSVSNSATIDEALTDRELDRKAAETADVPEKKPSN